MSGMSVHDDDDDDDRKGETVFSVKSLWIVIIRYRTFSLSPRKVIWTGINIFNSHSFMSLV